jgi:asparagine synthase (glutamine-hydrolysing)
MQTPDGRFVLTYNGEIYNFQELRAALEALGHRFRSRSDSEVLLVRDRFGVKPLYYAALGESVIFASEIKALLAHPQLAAALDPAGLVEYLTFQNFLGERTLFRRVRLLAPGAAGSSSSTSSTACSARPSGASS